MISPSIPNAKSAPGTTLTLALALISFNWFAFTSILRAKMRELLMNVSA